MTDADCLAVLPTPRLVLDVRGMLRNIARLHSHLALHGVTLGPHLKTVKSVEVARLEAASVLDAYTRAELGALWSRVKPNDTAMGVRPK